MAYNNKYLDERIKEIQDITLEYTAKGYTYIYIYRVIILPKYHISYSTFNNYLSKPIKRKEP